MRTRQPQLEYRLFDDVLGGEALTEGENETTPTLFDDVLGGEAVTEGENKTTPSGV